VSAAVTSLGKLILADNSAFATNPMRLDFIDLDLGLTLEMKDMNGTRGSLDSDDSRVRQNRTVIVSRIRTQPTAVELAMILQWVLGGTPTGSGTVTYPLANTPWVKYMWYLPNNGTQWQLQGCAVDNATFRSSSGEPLEVELEIVSQTYSNPTTGFPSTALDITTAPFLLSDSSSGITIASTTTLIRDVSVTVQNGIDRSRFLNSLTLTALNKLTRKVIWSLNEPAGDYDSNWATALAAGATMSAVFTQPSPATAVLSLTSNAVRFVPRNPQVPFQNESFLRLEGMAYRDSSLDPPIAATLHT
jgi:hypothetical protein